MVEKRVYQIWKGSNKFLFSGRLIFGPDIKSLFATIGLITVPVVIFCVFVARHLLHRFPNYNSGIAIMVITVALTIHVLLILLYTSSRDPGIVPRNAQPPEPEDYESSASPADWSGGTPRWRLPRTRDVIVNGVTVKVKYCDTCMLYRPPRCSHCSICNNCVERFDHHCPWVGQCIGQRNYRFFFIFVTSATLLCIYVFAMSALHIKFEMDGDPKTGKTRTVWQAVAKAPASMILIVYTFIAVWFVGGLTFFHLYLISSNQTTYENFRYRYESRVNPYNLGILQNFFSIFCTPIEKSKNNFRAKVQVDAAGHVIPNPQPSAQAGGNLELEADGQGRTSGVDESDTEGKDAFDEALKNAMGQPLPTDRASDFKSHPRRSSWGRKSGNWEITPEIMALAVGRNEGRSNSSVASSNERIEENFSNTAEK
ncbi:hypothetical protein KP509_09G057900 [Ceratopteris richardii]|uniref:S-acyltransferase n=1 Tax=Ceratopteris richardii TaxID=49495 RepID=A0A8T2U4H2_CERRI|nr:hypothetical protein KP509_09G057900 [Ceratopteris richardii]KAH7429598.1 hypothetical protein KP509_09G057900 [Ceratopteris richardii]